MTQNHSGEFQTHFQLWVVVRHVFLLKTSVTFFCFVMKLFTTGISNLDFFSYIFPFSKIQKTKNKIQNLLIC